MLEIKQLTRLQIIRYCEKLEKENRNLKEKLSEITMVSDDEKQSIEHILELEKENKSLKRELDVVKGIKNSSVNVLINADSKIKELEKENKYRKNQIKELKKELKAKKELLRYYQKKSW